MAEKLEEIEKGPESRRAVKAEAAKKRKASKTKKAKRKYRNPSGRKAATSTDEDEDVDDEIDDEDEELQAEAGDGMLKDDSGGEMGSSDIHGPKRTAKDKAI
jgi:hypothetical protein